MRVLYLTISIALLLGRTVGQMIPEGSSYPIASSKSKVLDFREHGFTDEGLPDETYQKVSSPWQNRYPLSPAFFQDNSGESWYPMTGISGADITALALSPSDPDVIYAGTWGSGVYRSGDIGRNWIHHRPASEGLSQSVLAVDPRDPDVVITYYYEGGHYDNAGLSKSADGGITWMPLAEGRFESVFNFVIHPTRPDTMYVDGRDSSGYYSFISPDNGLTWSTISGIYGFDELAFIPGYPDSVLAVSSGYLHSSNDGGFTFSLVVLPDDYGWLKDIQIDPTNTDIIYIAASDGLLKTADGGQSWDVYNTVFGYDPNDPYSRYPGIEQVAINTHTTGHLLVNSDEYGLFTTSDGGATWTRRELPVPNPRINTIVFSPADTTYLIGTWWQGIWRLGPQGWASSNEGLDNQVISGIEIIDKSKMFLSTLGNGFFATTDGGLTWEQRVNGLDSWHIHKMVSHPSLAGRIFAATYDNGLYLTDNGGDNWTHVAGETDEDGYDVYISPSSPDTAFAIGRRYNPWIDIIYRSTNAGVSWQAIFSSSDTSLYSIAIDPDEAFHVYLNAWYSLTGASWNDYLVESTDGGDTWNWSSPDSLGSYVQDYVFLPDTSELLISTWGAGVIAKDQSGKWISRDTTGLPEYSYLTFLALGPGGELVSGVWGGGVFRSWDRGYSWIADTAGLTSRGPLNFGYKVVGEDTLQIVGTYNGAYSYGYNVLSAQDAQITLPEAVVMHPNYPNPFNPTTTIHFELPQALDAHLVVYDILGCVAAELISGYQEAGYHQVIWNGRDRFGRQVPSGIYIARLTTSEYSKSIKMLLLK